MSKSRKSENGHPNSIKSYTATHEALSELLPYYLPDVYVDGPTITSYTNFFERLNYEEKWKPHSPAWEFEIVTFAETHAKEIRKAKNNKGSPHP